MDLAKLQKLCRLIRFYILLMTHAAQSGHTNSSLSAVELMAVLYFKVLQFDLDHPQNQNNDRIIFSKGHASPLFYALYAAVGRITEEELSQYRSFESNLEGHPSMRFPYTEGLTGSLGQGLSMGIGEALALRARISNNNSPFPSLNLREGANNSPSYIKRGLGGVTVPFVYVLLGDGEMAEGQVWEAIGYAAFKKVNNLIGIIDVNRLSQSEQTMYGHDVHSHARRIAAFGWRTYVVEDGHDLEIIDKAYSMAIEQSKTSDMPAMIIAKTIKGKGVAFWEDKNGWHSKQLPEDEYVKAVTGLGEIDKSIKGEVRKPERSLLSSVIRLQTKGSTSNVIPAKAGIYSDRSPVEQGMTDLTSVMKKEDTNITHYAPEEKVATKKAFGNALERMGGVYPDLCVLDGDMKNSTHIDQFEKKYPERFLQMYIAEQNMVSVAWGMANRGLKPLVCTFACFLTRAHDQFRLAALSGVTMYVCGAYAGISLGKDGPSQMGLEDMAMIRPLLTTTLLYPSDAIATERLVEEMLKLKGIVYIKTTREPTPIIYKADEAFPVGQSKTLRSSANDDVTIVAVGITVFEALKASEELKQAGIATRVIDCYSIKPIDVQVLKKAAGETKAIITVEDHYIVGGLGDAVLEALADQTHVPVYKLAVTKTPKSGKPEELLKYEEISANAIINKVKFILTQIP